MTTMTALADGTAIATTMTIPRSTLSAPSRLAASPLSSKSRISASQQALEESSAQSLVVATVIAIAPDPATVEMTVDTIATDTDIKTTAEAAMDPGRVAAAEEDASQTSGSRLPKPP